MKSGMMIFRFWYYGRNKQIWLPCSGVHLGTYKSLRAIREKVLEAYPGYAVKVTVNSL